MMATANNDILSDKSGQPLRWSFFIYFGELYKDVAMLTKLSSTVKCLQHETRCHNFEFHVNSHCINLYNVNYSTCGDLRKVL